MPKDEIVLFVGFRGVCNIVTARLVHGAWAGRRVAVRGQKSVKSRSKQVLDACVELHRAPRVLLFKRHRTEARRREAISAKRGALLLTVECEKVVGKAELPPVVTLKEEGGSRQQAPLQPFARVTAERHGTPGAHAVQVVVHLPGERAELLRSAEQRAEARRRQPPVVRKGSRRRRWALRRARKWLVRPGCCRGVHSVQVWHCSRRP